MYPILYSSNETTFVHNGLGILRDTISAIAVEELNGLFELQIEYDSEGFLVDVIREEMIIKAKANDKQQAQLFRIYSITKNHENDNLIIDAQHITYDLARNFVEKLVINNLTKRQVMELIGSSTVYSHPFNVTSTNNSTRSSTSLYRTNPLQMIGGMDGSVLQIWGGQIERDNYNLIMHDRRGSDDGVSVLYKKNLTGLTAKFDISNVVTRIYPFKIIDATDDEPERLITIPDKYIDSPYINDYEIPFILPVDFSNEEDVETSQDLLNAASGWFVETGRDRPRVEMEVKFEHLWETEEYKDVAALELVGLGDTVSVGHSKLHVEAKATVNRTEYDVIAQKNNAVEVGNIKASFTDSVNQNEADINKKIAESEQKSNDAIRAANGKNTIYYGPEEPTGDHLIKNDVWFRIVDGEYTRTYIFDGIQWQLSIDMESKEAQETAAEARNQAQNAVDKANLATSNANEAIEEAQGAFDKAQDSMSRADSAFNKADALSTVVDTNTGEISTVKQIAQGLQTRVSNTEGDVSTLQQTANSFGTRIGNAESNISTLTQTAQGLQTTVKSVRDDLDGLEIGGRNLWRFTDYRSVSIDEVLANYEFSGNANTPYINVASWGSLEGTPVYGEKILTFTARIGGVSNQYYLNPMENGERYIKLAPNTDYVFSTYYYHGAGVKNVNFTIWGYDNTGGNRERLTAETFSTSFSSQFKRFEFHFQTDARMYYETRIYIAVDKDQDANNTAYFHIYQPQLEQGTISTPYRPAPEDMATQSQITQLSDVISSKITKGQADGWYASQSQLTQTASSLQSTIKGVRDDLDGLQVGGRNLIQNSSNPFTFAVDDYDYRYHIIYQNLERNTTYTFSSKVEVLQGNVTEITLYPYLRPGEGMTATAVPIVNGRIEWTFTTDNRYDYNLLVYNGRHGETAGNQIKISEYQLEKGNKVTDWSPAPEDMATQSQISQLSDNISLRVQKNDIINQINVSTESILISGKKLILDGDTTVNGTFRVKNANITDVNAGKITAGTLDAGKANIVNINASNINTGSLTGIDVTSLDNNRKVELAKGQIRLTYGGELVGYVRPSVLTNNNNVKGFNIVSDRDYISLDFQKAGDQSAAVAQWRSDTRIGYIQGSDDTSDSGRLYLRSTSKGGTAEEKVPQLRLINYTDTSGTPWSGSIFYVGRDNRSPSNANFRSGLEVWQYKGDRSGNAVQLFKIDSDSNGSYTSTYTDRTFLGKKTYVKTKHGSNYLVLGASVTQRLQNIHGTLDANPAVYIDVWDNFTVGSDGTGSGTFNFSNAENIYAVFPQVEGDYSSNIVSGVQNVTSTGFRVYLNNVGGRTNANSRSYRVKIMVIYEPS